MVDLKICHDRNECCDVLQCSGVCRDESRYDAEFDVALEIKWTGRVS